MAIITQGMKELMEADLIPEGEEYEFKVSRVDEVGDKNYEVARCVITKAPDQELIGRRVDHFLGSPHTNWRGLLDLLKSAKLTDVPEDESGHRDTRTALVGLKFQAAVRKRDGNRGPENRIYPKIDHNWVAEHFGASASDGQPTTKRRRSRRGGNPPF